MNDCDLPVLQVKTNRLLDREKMDIYYFTVVARDGGSPALSSTTTVTIHVDDVNDNTPFFVYPTEVRQGSYMSLLDGSKGSFRDRVVCALLNAPATCKCISGTDLLRQFYVLPH